MDGGANGEGDTDVTVIAEPTGISTVRQCYQRNREYVMERLALRKYEVASFWDGDASWSDHFHPAGSSGSRVMSAMSPRSCWDRVGWRALGGNRGKDGYESDAFERVSVELACWVRVNRRCFQRKGNVKAFSLC